MTDRCLQCLETKDSPNDADRHCEICRAGYCEGCADYGAMQPILVDDARSWACTGCAEELPEVDDLPLTPL